MSSEPSSTGELYKINVDDGLLLLDYRPNKIIIHFDNFNEGRNTLLYYKYEGILKIDNGYSISDKSAYNGLSSAISELENFVLPQSEILKTITSQFNFQMSKYPNTYHYFQNAHLQINDMQAFSRYLFLGPEESSMRHNNKSILYSELIGFDDNGRKILFGNDDYRLWYGKPLIIEGKEQTVVINHSNYMTKFANVNDINKLVREIKLNREKN